MNTSKIKELLNSYVKTLAGFRYIPLEKDRSLNIVSLRILLGDAKVLIEKQEEDIKALQEECHKRWLDLTEFNRLKEAVTEQERKINVLESLNNSLEMPLIKVIEKVYERYAEKLQRKDVALETERRANADLVALLKEKDAKIQSLEKECTERAIVQHCNYTGVQVEQQMKELATKLDTARVQALLDFERSAEVVKKLANLTSKCSALKEALKEASTHWEDWLELLSECPGHDGYTQHEIAAMKHVQELAEKALAKE